MKKLGAVLLFSAVFCVTASATVIWPTVKYGQQVVIYFQLYDSNSPWRAYVTAPAADDVYVIKDGGTPARATNAVTQDNKGMKLTLTATEMQATVVCVDVNDESAPKLYGDERIIVPTHGNASALNAFDLDTASTAQSGDGYDILNSGTYGLAALKALIDTIDTVVDAFLAGGASAGWVEQ